MARYEDYLPGGKNYTGPEEVLGEEIEAAGEQQEERVSTPVDVDWEKRYNDLEVAYSRQGQQMGDYRALIDEHITSTPETEAAGPTEVNPITPDDIYEDPDAAVRRAVDSHPAIQEARDLKKELADAKLLTERNEFTARHPDMQATIASPEFANWVNEDPLRLELARRADGWDIASADALFTMYEGNTGKPEVPPVPELESGYGSDSPVAEQYSRSDMLQQKIRAKQGDHAAQAYVKANGAAYRIALGEGNVRD